MKRPWTLLAFLTLAPACSGALDVGSDGQSNGAQRPPTGSGSSGSGSGEGLPEQSATCTPLGPSPVALYEPTGVQMLRPLSDGTKVWFTAYDMSSTSQASAKLWSVNLATRVAAPLELTGFTGGLYVPLGREIAFVRTESKSASSLVLHDLDSHLERAIPNPSPTTMVASLRGHASGLYWTSREWAGDGVTAISRFATERRQLATIANHSGLITDGARVFFTRYLRGSEGIEIAAVAVDGSTEATTFVPGFSQRDAYVQVVDADANEVFYTVSRVENGGTIREGDLRATTKDGTSTRTLVRGQTFGGISDTNVQRDGDYFAWVDGDAQADIVRVKRTGGTPERITGETPTRYVNSVTSDACNTYWTVVNPPALYGRSRLP